MMRNWQPYASPEASAGDVADLFGTLTPAPMVSWENLALIRNAWTGPLMIKGLLHPQDAVQAIRLGADGIVVSNHGGRQLDAAPSPIEVLPAIREAVGAGATLILDSGVRRGSDVVIARCLGANSAIFGRPALYGVAVAGTAGVERALNIMRGEIRMVLTQLGCPDFEELNAGYLLAPSIASMTAAPEPAWRT
jgi:L-lactate dehydrogenase (cytochrome)/(S)-mandelate dehydrogenase